MTKQIAENYNGFFEETTITCSFCGSPCSNTYRDDSGPTSDKTYKQIRKKFLDCRSRVGQKRADYKNSKTI